VDSIALLAESGTDGWTRSLVYFFQPSYAAVDADSNNMYVYIKELTKGTGTVKPLYTDTVRLQYRGNLIPSKSYPNGYMFGQSFTEATIYDINEATSVPTLMAVGGNNVAGFCQALQQMTEKGVYHIVIPYLLGYGASSSNSAIPNYSTLIFDVELVKLYEKGEDTTWR